MARSRKTYTRADQLTGDRRIREALLKTFNAVEQGFADQIERSDEQFDWWDIYNCKLGGKQFYSGNTKLYIPAVHNAVKARKTRFTNQMFPQAGRYIEVTTEDGEIPHAQMALLEGYCRRMKLRTRIVPAMLTAGDVEGQYTLLVTWGSRERHTVSRETEPMRMGGLDHPDLGEVEVLKEDTLPDEGPEAEVVHDGDLLILPATCDSVDEALEVGGSVTVIRRWTKETLEALRDEGDLDVDEVNQLIDAMKPENIKDTEKQLADAAGIKVKGKHALIYRTWTKVEVGGTRRLVLAYYGGEERLLGARLCPYWCDMPDVFTAPVEKQAGVSKGISQIKPCADVQYLINDITNAGMDSAFYALLPVLMVDPQKSPNYRSLVMDLMAVWEVDPASTKVLEFPPLYAQSFQIVQEGERMIAQTLSVSPAMMPQSTGTPGRKRSQAEIALEQQVEVLSSADAVTAAEEDIMTPLVQFMAELDYQYRDKEVTVRTMGELGVKAEMVRVPPGSNRKWAYRWFGVEAARTAQQIQQQIGFLNVLTQTAQHPSIAQAGYRVNLVPVIKVMVENVFGPRLAPEVFESASDQISLDPQFENMMMEEGQLPMVSVADNHPQHMQAHLQWFQMHQYPPDSPQASIYRHHMARHQAAMQAAAQAQQMQQMMQQMQQQGGGGRNRPRGPRQGAQPQMPRAGAQQPAGAIHPDQMKGGLVQMPRRM